MEVLKSSRFWLALVALIFIGLLALLGRITGESGIAALMALLAGFGVAKAGGGSKAAPLKCVVGIGCLLALSATACATPNPKPPSAEQMMNVLKIACGTTQAAAQVTPILCRNLSGEKDMKVNCVTAVALLQGASVLCSQVKEIK